MGKQMNIRSDLAYELATQKAQVTGKTLAQVIEDALVADRAREDKDFALRFNAALAHDRALLRESRSNFKIEDLYDPDTGLPT
jgi:hypothetical protein